MPTVIAGERQIFAKSLGRVYVFENAYERAREIYEQQHVWPAVVSMTLNHLAVLAVQQAKDQAQVHALLEEAWRMEAIHYSMVQRYSGFPLLPCPSMQADSLNVRMSQITPVRSNFPSESMRWCIEVALDEGLMLFKW